MGTLTRMGGGSHGRYKKDLYPFLPPMEVTTAILILFAGLTIKGITDSVRVARQVFPDRAYLRNCHLVPHSMTGAVLSHPEQVKERGL